MAEHPVHTNDEGTERWTEAHGHCACGDHESHEPYQCEKAVSVVIRCRCGDPTSHLNVHCPQGVIAPLGSEA
jgi:hypothetical protein